MSVQAGIGADASASFDNSKHLTTVTVPAIDFKIGPVPFHINTTIPIDVELKLETDLKLESEMAVTYALALGTQLCTMMVRRRTSRSNFQSGTSHTTARSLRPPGNSKCIFVRQHISFRHF